jgi:hypothetical protein
MTDRIQEVRRRPAPDGARRAAEVLPTREFGRATWRHRARRAVTLLALLPTLASAQERPGPPPMYLRAAPDRPGWSVDARTGCWVWNSDPRLNDSVSWTGACSPEGRATGRGVEEWRDGDRVSRYEGEVQDGKAQGRGVYVFANGDMYWGEFRDDRRHGRGVFEWANGDRYQGEFRENKRDGRGVFTNTGGSRYDGEWRDGEQSGVGILTYSDGGRYEGEWRNGEKHGRGTQIWPDGTRYTGEWREDARSGRGVQIWADGTRYEGEWRAGRPDGFGVARINGIAIGGTWAAGCFHEDEHRAAIERNLSECP